MKSSLSQAIEMFFDPKTIVPFVLGSLAFAVLGSAIYDVCCNLCGTSTTALLRIALGALAIMVLAVSLVCLRIRWQATTLVEPEYRSPRSRRGLVFLVSPNRKEPCLKAVECHKSELRRLWLICSNRSAATAESLKEEVVEIAPHLESTNDVVVCHVQNVDEPLEYFNLTKEIYRGLPKGWREDDVITDYLGMTSNASVGVSLACLLHGWPLEYTQPQFDEKGKPMDALAPREIALRVQRRSEMVQEN